MFKNNISQFNDLCPSECLKNFIRDKLLDLGISGKKLENVDITDFTQKEIDFMTGCLVAHDDYSFDFLYQTNSCMDVKKLVVQFMLNAENYISSDFLLITKIKNIAVSHFKDIISIMIEDLKGDVVEDITEYFKVKHEKE